MNKYVMGSDIKVEESRDSLNYHMGNKNKREYIFSNEDDSLSFSYEKSK